MKMSRRKVRETIFLLLFRVEFNTQEELQEQIKWYFEERPDIEGKDQIYIETKIGSILKRLPEIDEHIQSVRAGDLKDLESQSLPFCVLQFMRLQMMRIFLRELPLMKP